MSDAKKADYLLERLKHLALIRNRAARLMARDQLDRDFFARGETEFVSFSSRQDRLKDLIVAYGNVIKREKVVVEEPQAKSSSAQRGLSLFEYYKKARR